MMNRRMTAVVADDEANLRSYLCQQLATLWPDLEVVGQAASGREALDCINSLSPDIAFLDIRMPGLSGLEVAQQLSTNTRVVFVTAFDEFAIAAFESAAVDYLLKPVEEGRLQKTIDRLRDKPPDNADLTALMDAIAELRREADKPLSWVRVGGQGETRIVPVDDIICFQADQKYTTVRTSEGEHLIRKSIKELEARLDPEKFWRIHRGTLVNLAFVEVAKRDLRGRFLLHMKGLRQPLKVSDTYSHRFRQM